MGKNTGISQVSLGLVDIGAIVIEADPLQDNRNIGAKLFQFPNKMQDTYERKIKVPVLSATEEAELYNYFASACSYTEGGIRKPDPMFYELGKHYNWF